MAHELKAISLNLDEEKYVKDISLKEKQEWWSGATWQEGEAVCWKGTMEKHGVGNDLLVTSPPSGSSTVSAELGAALDTQVLLLEQSDMFNHLPY